MFAECAAVGFYRARNPRATPLYRLVERCCDEVKGQWEERFEHRYGFWRGFVDEQVGRYLDCGLFENGNGYVGYLNFQVDPSTNRVTGTLLGTAVEGFLVDRHLVLHRYPQGQTQIWDGWVLEPQLGAHGQPYYSGDFIVAGTCSESKPPVDGVYPWFGIESGKTAGVPVPAGAGPGGTGGGNSGPGNVGSGGGGSPPLTGTAQVVAGALHGLRWEMPCAGPGAVCPTSVQTPTHTTRLGGDPNQVYQVALLFRGVVEYNTYAGGTQDGLWYVGGRSNSGGYNIYRLDISDPPQTYFLNADRAGIQRCFLINYSKTIRARGGATVTLSADAQDGQLVGNHDDLGNPIIVPGVPPAPQSFDGQFIQMDVLSVTP